MIENDRLIKINDEDVRSYSNKQLWRLIEKYGDVKVDIVVLREKIPERRGSTSKSRESSSEEDAKLNIELAQREKIKVNKSTKFQDPDAQRNVYISLTVTSLSNISNVDQTYRCTVILDCEWQPMQGEITSYLQMVKEGRNPDADWKPIWCPKFTFPNAMEIHRYSTSCFPVMFLSTNL